jgi:DNA-binding CsgD family transcriptional regulator
LLYFWLWRRLQRGRIRDVPSISLIGELLLPNKKQWIEDRTIYIVRCAVEVTPTLGLSNLRRRFTFPDPFRLLYRHLHLQFIFINAGKTVGSTFISMNTNDSEPTLYGELTTTTLSDLTSRELEIRQSVLERSPNKAIAVEMYISEKAVEFHLDHINDKIGLRRCLIACVWTIQQAMLLKSREIPS